MTAPDRTPWTVDPDGDGEPTLWHDGWAVLRRSDMATPRRYQELLWDLLTAALAPDEATIKQVAMELTRWNHPPDPFFVIRGRSTFEAEGADPYALIVKAVLAALADTSAQARHTADDTLREQLAWAMRGTVDGDLIAPDSEIPIGEAERLAYEFIREHVAANATRGGEHG